MSQEKKVYIFVAAVLLAFVIWGLSVMPHSG